MNFHRLICKKSTVHCPMFLIGACSSHSLPKPSVLKHVDHCLGQQFIIRPTSNMLHQFVMMVDSIPSQYTCGVLNGVQMLFFKPRLLQSSGVRFNSLFLTVYIAKCYDSSQHYLFLGKSRLYLMLYAIL